jgi:hypothetical protein
MILAGVEDFLTSLNAATEIFWQLASHLSTSLNKLIHYTRHSNVTKVCLASLLRMNSRGKLSDITRIIVKPLNRQ